MADFYEIGISAERAPALRTIIRHGLEDCERRLEKMAQEKWEAIEAGKEWTKHPESIPMEMYREAKRIVRGEMYVLRMMRSQIEPRKKA